MAGRIKRMVDYIVATRSKGDPILVNTMRVKLTLKGICLDRWDANSPDDPVIIEKLRSAARDFNMILPPTL